MKRTRLQRAWRISVTQPAPHSDPQARGDEPGRAPPTVPGMRSQWPPLARADGSSWWRVSVVALAATRATRTGSRWLAGTRWMAAGIFLSFGVTKFANHAAELASFRHYPLPAPGFFVYLVGVAEIGGGLLLAAGLLTRLAALALAADMIGAVVVSGLATWEVISLTLAPLLLAVMIILTRFGAGGWSVDAWLAARLKPDLGHASVFQHASGR